jgi:hypothetical protein
MWLEVSQKISATMWPALNGQDYTRLWLFFNFLNPNVVLDGISVEKHLHLLGLVSHLDTFAINKLNYKNYLALDRHRLAQLVYFHVVFVKSLPLFTCAPIN